MSADPIDRLVVSLKGATATVWVQELPDDATPKALVERLELNAWEQWDAYKRFSGQPTTSGGQSGLRLEFTARLPVQGSSGARTARVVQIVRFPKVGRRAISLVLVRVEGKALPQEFVAIESSFKVKP